MSLFLSPSDIAELTGIGRGTAGRTREQIQADTLRKMKIPHYVNAAGRPLVARAVIEGGTLPDNVAPLTWEPNLARLSVAKPSARPTVRSIASKK